MFSENYGYMKKALVDILAWGVINFCISLGAENGMRSFPTFLVIGLFCNWEHNIIENRHTQIVNVINILNEKLFKS